jgi:L-serine dehydratase
VFKSIYSLIQAGLSNGVTHIQAMAITLNNMLGLVCDLVARLVKVSCANRNAMGAANALVYADMALAGIKSRIPCDELIGAMYRDLARRCHPHEEKLTGRVGGNTNRR